MKSQLHNEVHVLGFGEPDVVSRDATMAYLERIFLANARLDDDVAPEAVRARCRDLAERRTPALLGDYERIGGSPMVPQCHRQAQALERELARRGMPMRVRAGMQFTEPSIESIAAEAVEAGAERVIGLPLYPLCGVSTTLAALETLDAALESAARRTGAQRPRLTEVTGWHAHPSYVDSVCLAVAEALANREVSFEDPGARLYFSAHGTPVRYLDEGPPYDRYVAEVCGLVAVRLGVKEYEVGYQNHSNRGIPWTAPSNEDLVPRLDAGTLVVVPISFIHEQSETLVELDGDFVELARAHDMEVVRVAVPWSADGLTEALADLAEAALGEAPDGAGLRPCRCRSGALCLNGDRQLKAPPTARRP